MTLLKPRYPHLNEQHPRTRGLVAGWPVYEGGGATLNDLSGRRNTGTLTNGPSWAVGAFGSCLSFSGGSSQYVSVAASGLPDISGDLTLAVWVNYASWTSRMMIFSLVKDDTTTANNSVDIEINAANQVAAAVWGGGTLVALNAPAVNVWHRVVLVQGGSNNTLYFDGVQVAQTTTARNSGVPTVVRLGSFNNAFPTPYYTGLLDSAAIWNRALLAGEVQQDYFDSFAFYRPPQWRRRFNSAVATLSFDMGSRGVCVSA